MDLDEPTGSGSDIKALNRARFELELEFVQSLANPFYVQQLCVQKDGDQPFIHFLRYLLYWQHKDYARFIHYPHALHHLELLQKAKFRKEMKEGDFFRDYLQQKQFDHWRTWRDPTKVDDATDGGALKLVMEGRAEGRKEGYMVEDPPAEI